MVAAHPEHGVIALVLGGAATLFDDIERAPRPDIVVAVNDAGVCYPRLDHWASLHPECFRRRLGRVENGWIARRQRLALNRPTLWGPANKPKPYAQSLETLGHGSSGFFGVEVAQHVGADRIVLCGIPMTESPHFDGHEPWEMANAHWKHWLWAHQAGKLRGVRSMSGRTRDLLGAPTREWLAGPVRVASGSSTEAPYAQ